MEDSVWITSAGSHLERAMSLEQLIPYACRNETYDRKDLSCESLNRSCEQYEQYQVQNIILSDFRRCLRDEFNEISTCRRKSSQQMVTENRKSFPTEATGGSGKAGGRFSECGRQRLPRIRDGKMQQESQPFGGGI
jgi:hypothetical protein